MNLFLIALITVACMLAYAVPGFLTVKTKLIKPQSISAFAAILMYVCQPALTIASFDRADFTMPLLREMGIFFAVTFVLQAAVLGGFLLLFRNKIEDVCYRVANVAAAFGNVGFLGIPILNALFPENPEYSVYAIAFLIGMNLLGWTIGSAIIAKDKRYVSLKKALLNPATLSLIVALPLFFTKTKLPGQLGEMIDLLGRMTTPLCMLIMGMRLATVRPISLVNQPLQYLAVFFKQFAFPLLAMAAVWFLPVSLGMKQSMVVLCAAPVASVVLNFAELLGEGQESAANTVLFGTALSVVTMPVLVLIMQQMPR